MRVVIPCSGGWNSTYWLWWALTNTDHEVISVHYRSDVFSGTSFSNALQLSFEAIVDWLRTNVREFSTFVQEQTLTNELGGTMVWSHPNEHNPEPSNPTDMVPIRPGFTNLKDGAFLRARYVQHVEAANRFLPDEFWTGLDNTNEGTWIPYVPIFQNNTSVKMVAPAYRWYNPSNEFVTLPDAFHIKRIAQIAALPPELADLVLDTKDERQFYRDVIVPSGYSIQAWDEHAEWAGAVGDSYEVADETTYATGDNWKNILSLAASFKLTGKFPTQPVIRLGVHPGRDAARFNRLRKT